jgi:Fur family ferric uptake transcriptional regulator
MRKGRGMNIRNTKQRSAIKDVFTTCRRPLSMREIHQCARKKVPRLGIATVYRSVNTLLDAGWLIRIDVPGNPVYYERAGQDHHHHFLCRSCHKIFNLPGCMLSDGPDIPKGFILENHDVILYGVCSACAA